MNHKVLLADDSLTIQKVIKITLANQPYDITDCSNEEELFQKLPAVGPRIVFLDFNLSEKYTGYELTSRIKSVCPQAKVLLLLGTFDTIDDAAFEKCGASDKIVKPFDSNKFISICKQLIESSSDVDEPEVEAEPEYNDEETSLPSKEDLEMPDTVASSDPEDQWQMSHSTGQSFSEVKSETPEVQPSPNKLDALTKEISDWGMSVPNIINEESPKEIRFDLPPVIGEVKSLDEHRERTEEKKPGPGVKQEKPVDIKFPDSGDLDYPTIEELQSSEPTHAPAEEKKRKEPQLVSIDSFNDKPMELEIEGNYVEDSADVSSIEAQIRDEVESDLWQADEFEDLKKEVSSKIEEMKNDFTPAKSDFDETLFKPLDEDETTIDYQPETQQEPEFAAAHTHTEKPAEAAKVDMEALRSEIEGMVKKYVTEYMDQMFKQNVEKISWEVIPDLAENLIRQELGKIANKVINDQE